MRLVVASTDGRLPASRRAAHAYPAQPPNSTTSAAQSGHGAEGALSMNADAQIEAGLFDGEERATKALDPQRLAYVHVARGEIEVNGQRLGAGDAAMLDGETQLELSHGRGAEVLVFDLAR